MERFITGILICLIAVGALAAELTSQRNSASGVTVTVVLQELAPSTKTWDFNVVLDTHSQELTDDLVKTATLFDDKGTRHVPISWEGAGPGGHHREGTLKFNAISPKPQNIELQIQRTGETTPRYFRWQL
jgi:hypothetical protein